MLSPVMQRLDARSIVSRAALNGTVRRKIVMIVSNAYRKLMGWLYACPGNCAEPPHNGAGRSARGSKHEHRLFNAALSGPRAEQLD